MRNNVVGRLGECVAVILLVLHLSGVHAQQKKSEPPVRLQAFTSFPDSPFDISMMLAGMSPPLQYEKSVAHTRPELANEQQLVDPQHLREVLVLGSEGVVDAGRFVLPFGTKGEKVALAFRSGEYVPPQGEKLQPALAQLAQERAAQLYMLGSGARPAVYALILLNGRMDETLQKWLESHGVEIVGFYPYTAHRARIPVDVLNVVASHPQVRWVGQPNPVQKLDPELLYFIGDTSGERIWVYVSLFAPDEEARRTIESMVSEAGVYDPLLGVLPVQADAPTVNRLLDVDAVLFVEPVRQATPCHTESMASINADLMWYVGHDGRPEGGRPIRVGVVDSGLNIYHQDFANIFSGTAGINRTTEGNWWNDGYGHGTLVTGTFIGEGRAQFRYRGTASGLRATATERPDLVVVKVFNSLGLPEGDSMRLGLMDMRVTRRQLFNCSFRSLTSRDPTDTLSRVVDGLFRDNILPVVAAGNEGPNLGTIYSPGVAKGALTVGAVYDDSSDLVDTITRYSSRGSPDGIIKPDVVAPGTWIDSCSNTDNWGYNLGRSGTSFAAPHVAGLAAGIIGHFGDWGIPAWAVRALILANAIPLEQPRYVAGFGKVDAMLCHYVLDGASIIGWGTNAGTGSLSWIDFTLERRASWLRVVLVYPDPQAFPGASNPLVNDLDLYLDSYPFTSGPSGEWRSKSRGDNVEFIEELDVPAGNYRIKVHTYAQNEDTSQNWAVAVRAVYGSFLPNIEFSLSAPVAVRPYEPFDVFGEARAGSYVASGVYGELIPSGVNVQSLTYTRYGPDWKEESIELPGRTGINQGNIPVGFPRKLAWRLVAAGEGSRDIVYRVRSVNGGTGSVSRSVIVDGTAPTNWQDFSPSQWTNDPTPDCRIRVQDTLSGLNTGALYYWYRAGSSEQGPFACGTSAPNGSTALEWIWANNVPFNREGGSGENQIRFVVYDRAGNYGDSGWLNVNIDWTIPQDWQNFTVTGGGSSGLTPTCTVQVRDVLSGLRVTSGRYRYSTNGGSTWSSWFSASVTGSDGTRAFETITASDVPFNQRSSTLNKIQFEVEDLAGNRASSPIYNVDTSRYVTSLDLENAEGLVGQQVMLRATLRRSIDSSPIAGKTVRFIVDGEAVGSAVTNSAGVATLSWTVSDGQLGNRPMIAQFAGDSEHLPTQDEATFRRYATTRLIVYDTEAYAGDTITLGATLLREDNNVPVQGRTLHFTVAGSYIGSATTSSGGDGLIDYTIPADTPPGGYAIGVTFDGDEAYTSCYGEGRLIVHEPFPDTETVIEVFYATGMQGESTTLAARLSRAVDGNPVPDRWLHFFVDGWYVSSERTDSEGYAAVSYFVPRDFPPGEHLIEVYFEGDSRYFPSSGYGTLFVYPRPPSISGVVELGDYVGDVSAQPVLFEIRYPGSTDPVEVYELLLDSEGRFYFETRNFGVFDVTAKASHWLRQKHREVSLWGDVTLDFYLTNGDVDRDNEVTLFDFGQLVAAFGSVPGDSNWNPDADLDGDQEVTLFDFGILVHNFGLIGDE